VSRNIGQAETQLDVVEDRPVQNRSVESVHLLLRYPISDPDKKASVLWSIK
jgi:hypothetical protein